MQTYDVVIIGAGAAGLMCAMEAGKRGRKVLVLEHNAKVGEKIRISGGGRCNFTNLHTSPANFISHNPRFCVSALKRFSQHDFIAMVQKHGIAYHEKTLGQLFCDGPSQQIITMLLDECHKAAVSIHVHKHITAIQKETTGFSVSLGEDTITCTSLVVATGGLSIPKMGATPFGYTIAGQFAIPIIPPRPALVPFTLGEQWLTQYKDLAGVSTDTIASCRQQSFPEAFLFTHRGLSGPAILQISSYWQEGDTITLNLSPAHDIFTLLKEKKALQPKQELQTVLAQLLPKRLALCIAEETGSNGQLANLSHKQLQEIADFIHHWRITPNGTEGFKTAEVTAGGIDTRALSSKTFECTTVRGLYFIGEVVDVTGHLGGFNFQWAWSSGYAAGQYV